MSSPIFRCAFCRLHRNDASPARPCHCHSGLDGLTESEIYSAIGTPAPTRVRSTKKAPTRRRQQPHSSESDNDSTFVAPSPLQDRSTNFGTALATTSGLFSPSESQEPDQQAVTVDDGPHNIQSNDKTPEPEFPEPETTDPESPQQILSPASTQIVHETPLPQPRSRSVGISTEQILSPASTQIVPETPLPQQRSRSSSIQIDFANHIQALDNAQLRRSRKQMTTELEERTAQVDRLITRGRILEAEKIAQQAVIAQTQIELIQARLDAVEAEQRIQWKHVVALIMLIVLIGFYAVWCGHKSEDFIYADQVRRKLFNGR